MCPKCAQQLSADDPYCPIDHSISGGVHAVTAGMLARTPRSKQHLLGVTIGEAYIINGYLGAGGFGAVYRAEQRALARDVAIKVLMVDPEVDPAVISRFKREARTAASLLDPNVVTLFDYGETSLSDEENDRLLYFVMELVHGPTLRQYLRTLQRGVGLESALKLGVNILRGLAAAHHMGVVHRDLKPGNVLIDESKGRKHFARLFDFGISSLQGSGGHTTRMGAGGGVIGTPKYMAPEQWRAQTTAPCTDVYAFGVMMAEMLLGQPPIPKMELAEMAAAHCRSPRPHVQQTGLGEAVPLALTNFIKKCMAIDPRQRYGSAREALDVLTAIDEA
ncbi:MAG: serine/threonine protein kinase, partial [Myxococcales bacterium]|nr:serine/threonine protein kinase [Myxococcales bacterium]